MRGGWVGGLDYGRHADLSSEGCTRRKMEEERVRYLFTRTPLCPPPALPPLCPRPTPPTHAPLPPASPLPPPPSPQVLGASCAVPPPPAAPPCRPGIWSVMSWTTLRWWWTPRQAC